MSRILVDSNILIYATSESSPKNMMAQHFLNSQTSKLVIAQQNILEAIRVLTHPKFPHPMSSSAALEALQRITAVIPIIVPERKTHELLMLLVKQHHLRGDAIFDAYLAATALTAGITTIATDNVKDFQKFTEIKVLNPFKA